MGCGKTASSGWVERIGELYSLDKQRLKEWDEADDLENQRQDFTAVWQASPSDQYIGWSHNQRQKNCY